MEKLLRIILEQLEDADREGVKAKQQLARIIGEDHQVDTDVIRVYCDLAVQGISREFRPKITSEHCMELMSVANGGSAQDVHDKVLELLTGQVVYAADVALAVLIAGLQGKINAHMKAAFALGLSLLGAQRGVAARAAPAAFSNPTYIACKHGTPEVCDINYTQALCAAVHGTPHPQNLNQCPFGRDEVDEEEILAGAEASDGEPAQD